jgi:hypothetical protein
VFCAAPVIRWTARMELPSTSAATTLTLCSVLILFMRTNYYMQASIASTIFSKQLTCVLDYDTLLA